MDKKNNRKAINQLKAFEVITNQSNQNFKMANEFDSDKKKQLMANSRKIQMKRERKQKIEAIHRFHTIMDDKYTEID